MHRWLDKFLRLRWVALFLCPLVVLATCGGPPGVLVDIGSWPDQATSLRVDVALNGIPFSAPVSLPDGATRFVITLPEGDSGQLSLSVAALDGSDCPRATGQAQVAVGTGLRRIAEVNAPMTLLTPPYCPTPHLDGVTPPLGKNTASSQLNLSGGNFATGASVMVGGVVCGNARVASSSQITCTLPARPGTCGPQPVVVTNLDQQMTSKAEGFSFVTSVFTLQAATPATQTVQSQPRRAAAGDFNRDGKMDLVTANYNSNSFSLLLGNGDGSFQTVSNFTAGANPSDIGVADLNGDAKLDVILANLNDNNLDIYLGNGDGTFQGMQTVDSTDPHPVALALSDLNGDNKVDIAVGSFTTTNLCVLLGKGDGTFHAATQYAVMGKAFGVTIADVNGDRSNDLVASGFDTNQVNLLLGNGDGTFQGSISAGTSCLGPIGIACMDVTGDAKPDIVVACSGATNVGLLPGQGDGTFEAQQLFTAGNSPQTVWLGDVDGDGQIDAVVSNLYSDDVSYLPGLGSRGFGAAVNTPIGTLPQAAVVTDLNNDRLPDIVGVNTGDMTLNIYLQQCK